MRRGSRALLLSILLIPSASWTGTALRVTAGGVMGLVAGTGVSLGIVVGRARFDRHFIESTRDLLSWQGLPIPLGVLVGAATGVAGGGALAAAGGGLLMGGVAGAGAGVVAGSLVSDEPEDRWAGGVVGGAAGIAIGMTLGLLLGTGRRRRGAAAATLLAGVLVSAACDEQSGPVQPVAGNPVPEDAAPAEAVVFLVGDPGKARYRHYPIIPRVAREVEARAERIGRDSAVTVLMLGDIVYPDGMHDPGTAGFRTDSARVSEQVDVVRTPGALEHDAGLYFVAGNHDWGFDVGAEGARRLRNLGTFLDRARSRGANVDLVPPAGSGVPGVVDLGPHLRIILLDTAWWLFDAEPEGKEAFIEGVAAGLATAGGRRVVVAGHHPFQSGGPHGGLVPFWETIGIQLLLQRSGAMLQDLSSRPYTEMRSALAAVFREHGRPLAFVGGHEHSLQLIRHRSPGTPRYSLVSGSASKLTGVGPVPGTMFAASVPGYIVLVVRRDGAVDLEVVAAPDRYLACPEDESADEVWERCMAEGVDAFEPVYTTRLAGPVDDA